MFLIWVPESGALIWFAVNLPFPKRNTEFLCWSVFAMDERFDASLTLRKVKRKWFSQCPYRTAIHLSQVPLVDKVRGGGFRMSAWDPGSHEAIHDLFLRTNRSDESFTFFCHVWPVRCGEISVINVPLFTKMRGELAEVEALGSSAPNGGNNYYLDGWGRRT